MSQHGVEETSLDQHINYRLANKNLTGALSSEDQAGAQLARAKLQAAYHGPFGMRARVSGIAQHEQLPGHSVEHGVNGHAGIGAAQDGAVRCLAAADQGLPHGAGGGGGSQRSGGKPPVARLQQLQRLGLGHGSVGARAHAVHAAARGIRMGHAWGNGHRGVQQLALHWALPQEFHASRLQVVDAAMDLDLPSTHALSDGLAVAHQEGHGLEDVPKGFCQYARFRCLSDNFILHAKCTLHCVAAGCDSQSQVRVFLMLLTIYNRGALSMPKCQIL